MEPFLRRRGLAQGVIDRMIADKIDCDVITQITDEQLKTYLPAYGDRIALMAFASIEARRAHVSTDSEPGTSYQTTPMRGTKRKYGNSNAIKATRRVEMGWLHQSPGDKCHKQVKSRSGGGTRNLSVLKTCTICDILTNALDTFFPDGLSKMGPLTDMLPEMRDFKGDVLAYDKTVETVYGEGKMKMLRLYLYTSHVQTGTAETNMSASSDDELPPFNSVGSLPRAPTTDRSLVHQQPLPNDQDDTRSTNCPLAPSTDAVTISSPDPEVTFNPRHSRSMATVSAPPAATIGLQEDYYIVDSEDEEIQSAIQASLQNETTVEVTGTQTLSEILAEFQKNAVLPDVTSKVIVFRNDILQSALRALDRKALNPNARLYVKFSGEMGEDFGGPRREFFRLAIQELHQSRFFEGPEGAKVFTHDLACVEKKQYMLIGRLVALSMAQDGPGLHFLDGNLYDLMVGVDVRLTNVDMHLPKELTALIEQLEDVDSPQKRDVFLVEHGDRLMDQGFGNPYTMDAATMIHMLKKQYLYYRISSEASQFVEGMNEVGGAWNFTKQHAAVMKPLFCEVPKELSCNEITQLFKFELSEEGTNQRIAEDVTVYAWEIFILSIEDGEIPITFPELLIFATGADRIPPCGFRKKIEIEFYTLESAVRRRLPSVSTCSLQMWLPRGQDPESLTGLLVRAIKESGGFLKI